MAIYELMKEKQTPSCKDSDKFLNALREDSVAYVLVRFDKDITLQMSHRIENPILKAALVAELRAVIRIIEESIFETVRNRFESGTCDSTQSHQFGSAA